MKQDSQTPSPGSRRDFLRDGVRGLAFLGLGGIGGFLSTRGRAGDTVWQIDPEICVQCGKCATHCVRQESAVKVMHNHHICGYCELCTAFFEPDPNDLNTGAENQLCPTGAILRRFVEDPYYEYTIDESLCIGCGKCVKGCEMFGNGSMFLQIKRDLCLDCNECAIAVVCPSRAISRIPAEQAYLLKTVS
ncbi:MAG: 4Fe-4S binding protein [Planctomycetes bacterium]|nr:4Fe-4S binding protein [Planctomycetota bacterium]